MILLLLYLENETILKCLTNLLVKALNIKLGFEFCILVTQCYFFIFLKILLFHEFQT